MLWQADKPGIIATVGEARDPKACKYTEEGTLLHEMMQRVYKSDRRMGFLSELEVTLTAADKASITDAISAMAAEKGVDAKASSGCAAAQAPAVVAGRGARPHLVP